jgi:hypothetical protein
VATACSAKVKAVFELLIAPDGTSPEEESEETPSMRDHATSQSAAVPPDAACGATVIVIVLPDSV